MDKHKPPSANETKVLEKAYAALNRNDISGFVEMFDPQIERTEPKNFPGEGIYRGLAAVTKHS